MEPRMPNFDHRLDDDARDQDPEHIRTWRREAIAHAQKCRAFIKQPHNDEYCAGCRGPRYAHPAAAFAQVS